MEDTLSGDGWFSASVKKSFAAVAHSLLTSTASAAQDSSAQAPRRCDLFSSIIFPRWRLPAHVLGLRAAST